MMILYFSATGNSMHVAKMLDNDAKSIPQMIKQGTYEFKDDKIGIVFPVYAWSAPTYIIEFLKKARFETDYLFAIATYGAFSGSVANQIQNIVTHNGCHFSYINKVKMLDNYLPTFDMERSMKKIDGEKIKRSIVKIKTDIDNGKRWILPENFFRKAATHYMMSREGRPFNKTRLKIGVVGEGIENYVYVEDTCTQCKVCSKVCPVDNIRMSADGEKIVFSDKCFMCMSCLHNCPNNAIHIRGEVSKARYLNENVTLKDIISANK